MEDEIIQQKAYKIAWIHLGLFILTIPITVLGFLYLNLEGLDLGLIYPFFIGYFCIFMVSYFLSVTCLLKRNGYRKTELLGNKKLTQILFSMFFIGTFIWTGSVIGLTHPSLELFPHEQPTVCRGEVSTTIQLVNITYENPKGDFTVSEWVLDTNYIINHPNATVYNIGITFHSSYNITTFKQYVYGKSIIDLRITPYSMQYHDDGRISFPYIPQQCMVMNDTKNISTVIYTDGSINTDIYMIDIVFKYIFMG